MPKKRNKHVRPRILVTDNLLMHLKIHSIVTKKNMDRCYRDLIVLGLYMSDRYPDEELKKMLKEANELYLWIGGGR